MANADEGHRLTEQQLAELECRIAKLYKEAADEVQSEIDAYFESFRRRDEEMKARLDAGEVTKEYYTQWRLNQIGRGERYQALRDKLAKRYTEANATAVAYTNDATPGIYTLNRNYAAYTIEAAGANVDFALWDEQTVRRLAVEQPNLMPYYPKQRALKRGIDLAYGKRQITASVTSSILQEKSIKGMADDLQRRLPEMNRNSAIRTARTAVTGAQNAGRQAGYEAAEKMGIKLKKEWIATRDNRTRHAHAELDGQMVASNKPFEADGYELMYPGDTSAPAYLVYNCRCTVAAVVVDDEDTDDGGKRLSGASGGKFGLSYREWAAEKKMLQDSNHRGILNSRLFETIQIGRNVGAAAFRDDVILPDGRVVKITEGSRITKIVSFAGKGSSKVLRVAEYLARQYDTDAEGWSHKRGDGYVDVDGQSIHAELHWFEHTDVGRIKMKVKRFFNDES